MKSNAESSSASVERALAILESVASRSSGMSNSEISRKLEIPKSSASYILRTLEKCGYLYRDAEGKYLLGLKLLNLGQRVQIGADIKEAALPVMKKLVERTGLTAHLAVLDHGEMVYVEKVDPSGFFKTDTWIGKRMQVNATAVGKAVAAHLAKGEVEALIKQPGLKKRTPKTITHAADFFRELETIRAKGYAVDDEENSIGARCVAVSVFDGFGNAIAAVGLSGTTGQVDRTTIRKIAETLQEATRRISQQLPQTAGLRATHF
jgi:DNA-binding IclR family transcriptional regulator